MLAMSTSDDKAQFNIYIGRETRNRLEALAREFSKGKGTKVAAEIIESYVEMWAEAEKAREEVIKRQQEAFKRAIQSEMLKLPIKNAATERDSARTQGRKTK
jgi:predicted DNA-binding protein